MKTSQLGIQLIKHYESLNDNDLSLIGLQPKMDPRGIWTSGYGHAIVIGGKFLIGIENESIAYQYTLRDEIAAINLLTADLTPREDQVNSLRLKCQQPVFDSLVSFTFNEGFENLFNSTLLKRIKTDMPPQLITEAFLMWNEAGGKIYPGLTYRRQTEALLCTTGKLKFFN